MNKIILTILSLIFLIITSCEEKNEPTEKDSSIIIQSPYEDDDFIFVNAKESHTKSVLVTDI